MSYMLEIILYTSIISPPPIYQFYCVQKRVAIPVHGSCYYTIIVRQEKVIPIAKITNCIYTTFPTIVLCFTYK